MSTNSLNKGSQNDLKRAKRKSIDIERQILIDKNNMKKEAKILLLGQPGSGKKTIIKQMNLDQHFYFTEEERNNYKELIFSNIIKFMRIILKEMSSNAVSLQHPNNKEYVDLIENLPNVADDEVLPDNIANAIKELWKDEGVQECYNNHCKTILDKTVKDDFESIDRIRQPNYTPTDQDILNCCIKNCDNVSEILFHYDNWKYRIINVNGLKTDHRKWISCFENVSAVVIVTDISGYNENSEKDEGITHLQEDINFFETICKSKWFEKSSIILFLNKTDVFKEKLAKFPLNQYFSDYSGGDDYDQALAFIKNRFESLNEKKKLYIKFNSISDTQQFEFLTSILKEHHSTNDDM